MTDIMGSSVSKTAMHKLLDRPLDTCDTASIEHALLVYASQDGNAARHQVCYHEGMGMYRLSLLEVCLDIVTLSLSSAGLIGKLLARERDRLVPARQPLDRYVVRARIVHI